MFPLKMFVFFYVCKCPRTLVSTVSPWPPCCISPLAYLSRKQPPKNLLSRNHLRHREETITTIGKHFTQNRVLSDTLVAKDMMVMELFSNSNRPSLCLIGPFAKFSSLPLICFTLVIYLNQ